MEMLRAIEAKAGRHCGCRCPPDRGVRDCHLPGAVHIELGQIPTSSLPAGSVTVMCGHGGRAMTAASLRATRSGTDVAVLHGGPDTWSTIPGRRLETGR